MKKIKFFLKEEIPGVIALYHKVRLFIRSWIDYPLYGRIYIENTNIKIPVHNPEVYGLSTGGGRVVGKRLYYEENLIETMKKLVKNKKVFFDVGAHIGYWSYIATTLGMETIAFEPIESRADIIRKTAIRYSLPITVVHRGNDIDGFSKRNNITPDFIKIDVDGEEVAVINGAKETLKQHKPDLMIEVRSATQFLIDDLKMMGYREIKRLGNDSVCVFLTTKSQVKDTESV